jgi:hypothetical protein
MPQPKQVWTRRREAARSYQPKRVRLLLLAESPPSDDRYFYFEDEATADNLFEDVCEVILEAKPRGNKAPYLKELRRRGVFLAEVKPDAPRSGEALGPYVGPLLLNVGTLAPEKIVIITTDAYDAAYAKLKQAGLPVVDVRVPFPATDHPPEFRQRFRQALVRADLEKLIRPMPAPRPKTAAK